MSPRRRANLSSTGFDRVRLWPGGGHFGADITAAGERVWLGTFDTKDKAARLYDVAAWRFGRPRRNMNFPEIGSREQADAVTPQPRFVTQEDQRVQRWLAVTKLDEWAMAQ
ncbi:ethylene-responsive transcription factor ERF071-like [Lolium perenne]|uniref:ethylene-responsive transcription factor ERF071-like n=1 Tax=Lolium perenne TaxID=4522 RepID=UPI0021F65DD4|nr:ethylene-responsive transcription factor ERF071-like [Lolium perenne]